MNKLKSIKDFIVSHYIVSAVGLVVLLSVGYKFYGPEKPKETYTVKRGNVIQKVIVNGKTKPVDSVDLAFEVSGTVRSSLVKIGSRVTVGQTLATLDQSVAYADLLKAKANLSSEQAYLEELLKGAKPEDIAVSETEVRNAEVAFDDAKRSLVEKITDILNNNVDQLFSNPHSTAPHFNLFVADIQLKNDIENGRAIADDALLNLKSNINNDDLQKITDLVNNVAKAVNIQTPNSLLTQTILDGYKTSLSTAKSTLISVKEDYNSSLSALNLAKNNLVLKKSGSTPEAINVQKAKILQNEAAVQSAEATLSKMTLRSPQNGIVTVQDAKAGEIVTAGKAVISVISDNNLEIESNVSEVNIGKVSVENNVDITFDAFPNKVFSGTVTYIEPGETIVDGVVNYKVRVSFSENYPEMKSGLTSKLEIITGSKTGVLNVPQYAITNKDGGAYVSKKVGNQFQDVKIETGLRGQDGLVEVLSGLNEGDVLGFVAVN